MLVKNENSLRTVLPRRFQEIERPVGVHGKVHVRIPCRPIVGGLSCRVDDHADVSSVMAKNTLDCFPVANINIPVGVAPKLLFQLDTGGGRGCLGSEETGPHVIVNADYTRPSA